MQVQTHISFAKLLVCAALAVFVAAPAAFADTAPTAPAFPSAVPSQPGALTAPDSASDTARAQERYYTSHGKPTPLTPGSTPAADDGIDWSTIGIAIGGTCLLAGALIALVMRTRRRTSRVSAVA